MLEAQLQSETEPEKRSKLQALLTGVTTAGREVVVSLTTAWMRQQGPPVTLSETCHVIVKRL
jgi:hypothetical protein